MRSQVQVVGWGGESEWWRVVIEEKVRDWRHAEYTLASFTDPRLFTTYLYPTHLPRHLTLRQISNSFSMKPQ